MSLLNTGVFALTSSFAAYQCFHHLEPRSRLPLLLLCFIVPALLSIPISYHVPWASAAAVFAFVTYWSALTCFTLMYRFSPFHPLAKYPGPAIAKASKLWGSYHTSTGNIHRCYKNLHERFGDVVRVGPNELSIRDSSLIHPVLGQGRLSKGPRWGEDPTMLIARTDPISHMEQRKPWNRAFSSAAVKEYEIIAANRIRQLVGCLEDMIERSDEKTNAVVDMTQWMRYFSTDVMGDVAFGGGLEHMKAGRDIDGLWIDFEFGIIMTAVISHVPYILPLFHAIMGMRSPLLRLIVFCRTRVSNRLRMGAKRKDLFYYLCGEELPESERPHLNEDANDGVLAILAGADTTSSVLTAVFYYLLRNPVAYRRLQAEVDGAFSSRDEPLDVVKLSQMEWLNGCINETLRLQPVIPSGSQWTVGKGKGAKIFGDLVIPEETQLSLHTYSIHRDPRNFHTPEAFLPERWLGTVAPAREHNTSAFLAFSYEPTKCVGKNLALMELRMLLCWVLRRFRFSEAPGVGLEGWDGRISDWIFLVHQDPLLVSVSLRK
ncbi:Cytochrome P450 [Lactarius tabidus]